VLRRRRIQHGCEDRPAFLGGSACFRPELLLLGILDPPHALNLPSLGFVRVVSRGCCAVPRVVIPTPSGPRIGDPPRRAVYAARFNPDCRPPSTCWPLAPDDTTVCLGTSTDSPVTGPGRPSSTPPPRTPTRRCVAVGPARGLVVEELIEVQLPAVQSTAIPRVLRGVGPALVGGGGLVRPLLIPNTGRQVARPTRADRRHLVGGPTSARQGRIPPPRRPRATVIANHEERPKLQPVGSTSHSVTAADARAASRRRWVDRLPVVGEASGPSVSGGGLLGLRISAVRR
jgi:hypothetical protein